MVGREAVADVRSAPPPPAVPSAPSRFVSRGRARSFTADDVALGEEVALRIAMAMENAELYRRAQAAIRIREDFVSIASHELKTPLTPLKLQLSSTRKRLPEDRQVLAERLAILDRQVDKIDQLVSQLLDVSRIAGGRMELEPQWVDLRQVVERVVERFATNEPAERAPASAENRRLRSSTRSASSSS